MEIPENIFFGSKLSRAAYTSKCCWQNSKRELQESQNLSLFLEENRHYDKSVLLSNLDMNHEKSMSVKKNIIG